MALDESGHRLVVIDRTRRMEQLLRHAQLRLPGKKRREAGGQDLRRDHEHQAVGHLDQAAAGQDVGLAVGVVRADELVAEAQRAAEIGGPGLFGDEGIGPGLDHASVDVFGAENAAEPRRRFVESVFDVGAGAALFFEREGGGESGDASADDGDAIHGLRLPASGFRLPAGRSWRIFLHEAREVLHIVDRSFGQNAVAEIEDVAGASGGALQNIFRARFQFFPVGEQQHGIEIALHRAFDARAAASLRRAECASRDR